MNSHSYNAFEKSQLGGNNLASLQDRKVEADHSTTCNAGSTVVPEGGARLGSISLIKPVEVFSRMICLVMFLFDISFSMSWNKKFKKAKSGLHRFAKSLTPLGDQCRVGLIEFNDRVLLNLPLSDPAYFERNIQLSEPDGATNILDALSLGGDEFANHSTEGRREELFVVLTDGDDTCHSRDALFDEAAKQKAAGRLVMCIGYGDDAEIDVLRTLASPGLCFEKGANGNEIQKFLHLLFRI